MAKREALSLLDLTPRYEYVDVDAETKLRVRALSSKTLTALMVRFPELRLFALGQGIKARELPELAPQVMAALCAAATGEFGNEKAEEEASELPIELQMEIIETLWRVTLTNGFGPFVKKWVALAQALSAQVGKAPDTSLQPLSKSLEEQQTPPSGT